MPMAKGTKVKLNAGERIIVIKIFTARGHGIYKTIKGKTINKKKKMISYNEHYNDKIL